MASSVVGRRIVVSGEAFASTAAALLARLLRDAARERRGQEVSLALAGGSTPVPVYRRLAVLPGVPWERTRILFGDERRVPPDHPESNYRIARESLLSRIPTPPGRVDRLEGEAPDAEAEADRYAALLPDRLDLLLLGIGRDGHTASLFPGSPAARERKRRVVPSLAPVEPRERFTVTPPAIRGARRVVALVRGPEKAEAVRRALEGAEDPLDCPARLARRGVWVLDREAAGRLAGGGETGGPTGRLDGTETTQEAGG